MNNEPDDSEDENQNDDDNRILSVAQDIVFGTSKGKMWTPKHIGLGCTLHQATRSKQLV